MAFTSLVRCSLPQQEISRLLDGELRDTPRDEAEALVFAQHYADTLGVVDADAWRRIVAAYGVRKARGIRAAICMIMAGNAQGNIWGAFASRLKGKPQVGSNLGKELGVLACDVFAVPFMLIWAAFAGLMRRLLPDAKEVYNFQ